MYNSSHNEIDETDMDFFFDIIVAYEKAQEPKQQKGMYIDEIMGF